MQVDFNIQPGQNVQIDCDGYTWGVGRIGVGLYGAQFSGCDSMHGNPHTNIDKMNIWEMNPGMPTARGYLAAAFDDKRRSVCCWG